VEHPKKLLDVAIVGGGPAGSFSAFELAKRGVEVVVFEEHPAIGEPSHCAGHLSIRSLRALGLYPLPNHIVENVFSKANFYSTLGSKFSVQLSVPVTCAVNRGLFDQFLARKAQEAGAKYSLGSQVQSLQIENGVVKGLTFLRGGVKESVLARIVIDAEGVSSRLLKQTGLRSFGRESLVYAVEAEVDRVKDVEDGAVEVYFGKEFASGLYAWLIPRLDGSAKVGLATDNGNPAELLERFMRMHPVASKQLKNAVVTRRAFHVIPLGGPIVKSYVDGFLAVGDVASQVKSTTGGGVIFSLSCAKIAAEVVSEAINLGDYSDAFLRRYQKRFIDKLGFDIRVMIKARKMLNRLSDEKLDRAVRFAAKIGLSESLRGVDEIDFQGRTLLSVLKKPGVYAALGYFFLLYLSENA
jgi:digeranylgeranylglycerophospholipid reductase